jgi:YaiO family outer membrane protein
VMNETPDSLRRRQAQRTHCSFWLFAVLLLVTSRQHAFAEEAAGTLKNRIEIAGSYEYVSPHDVFGDWETVSVAFYRKERQDFTWYAELDAFARKEGKGILGVAGAYKDWTDTLYTYTALAVGTNTVYLPETRIDHTFNMKFGPEHKFVWLIGATSIHYYTHHRDFILSTGLTAYLDVWVPEYRIFRNISSPGSVESYSHLLSLAYGREMRQWTTAVVGFGKQAYQASQLATPGEVSSNSLSVTLKHRRWLKNNYGIMGELSYFDLQGTYKKGGFQLGVFREF